MSEERRQAALQRHIELIKAKLRSENIAESDKDTAIKELSTTVLPGKNIQIYLEHIYQATP